MVDFIVKILTVIGLCVIHLGISSQITTGSTGKKNGSGTQPELIKVGVGAYHVQGRLYYLGQKCGGGGTYLGVGAYPGVDIYVR